MLRGVSYLVIFVVFFGILVMLVILTVYFEALNSILFKSISPFFGALQNK